MILAFSITYPNLFSKFLESGKKIELTHSVYKKIFNEVISEVSVNPHTRETILKHLNDKGFNPQVLLKFEIESLLSKPDVASKILDEKVLRLDLENLNEELKNLNLQIFSVSVDEVPKMQEKIQFVKDEIQKITEKLEEVL